MFIPSFLDSSFIRLSSKFLFSSVHSCVVSARSTVYLVLCYVTCDIMTKLYRSWILPVRILTFNSFRPLFSLKFLVHKFKYKQIFKDLVEIYSSMALNYELLTGHRAGSTLLYLPSEQNLYVKNSSTKNVQSFVCYQKILRKNPNKMDQNVKCGARVTLRKKNNGCYRNKTEHSCHRSHLMIYKDLLTMNQVKSTCHILHELLGDAARQVNTRKIFNNVISK